MTHYPNNIFINKKNNKKADRNGSELGLYNTQLSIYYEGRI